MDSTRDKYFHAVIASLVLALLARCVSLLRYDVFPEGDVRKGSQIGLLAIKSAWMPPVLAVLFCGLQCGFWEHATSATGEMPALLSFAFTVRCLLEYRITKDESWLVRGVMAFGVGMADNWVMIGYFPVLLAALIRLKGFSACLKLRFLFRMTLCAIAGMLLCLLLPMLVKLWSSGMAEMWAAVLGHFRTQKQMLWLLQLAPFRLLALTGVIPFLILSVRWKSHTIQPADDTPQGVFFAKATGHFIHAMLMIVALWFALETRVGPKDFDSDTILLMQSFVWAMSAGYCVGYMLLFKQGRVQQRPSKLAATAVRLLMLAVTAVLLWKNFRSVQLSNSAVTREFAKALADDLPAGKAVVLSEEWRTLLLLRGELGARGRVGEVMLVRTPHLLSPQYHKLMAMTYGARWPMTVGTNRQGRIMPEDLVKTVSALVEKEAVFYAHPSSGLFFEKFTGEPNGAVQRLVLRNDEEVSIAPLAAAQVAEVERRWQTRWSSHIGNFAAQAANQAGQAACWQSSSLIWLRVAERENATAKFLGGVYSKMLNHWGVQLQRAGRSGEALEWFRRAITLNPVNLPARINLEYAERRARGDNSPLAMSRVREHFADAFDQYESWYEVISRGGPVDEPTYLLQTGRLLLTTGNPRQAVAAFRRCVELSPNWPMPKLFEAQSHNKAGTFERALELTMELEGKQELFRGAGLARLVQCRVNALRGLDRTNEAGDYLDRFVSKHAKHNEVLSVAATLYAESGRFDRELELLVELSARVKPEAGLLTRRGLAEFRLGRNKQAAETLTRALDLSPEDVHARLLRAVVRFNGGQPDAARADYELLLKNPATAQPALLGLGNMAWSAQDTNAAICYYERFMSNNAAMTPQAGVVSERLKQMKDEQ